MIRSRHIAAIGPPAHITNDKKISFNDTGRTSIDVAR